MITSPPDSSGAVYRTARRTSMVAAAFCAVVLLLLIANTIAGRATDPLQPLRLTEMELQLNREPQNEALRARVRREDVALRRAYLRHRAFATTGFYLLLGGLAVFLVSLEMARRREQDLPIPRTDAARDFWLSAADSRRSVIGLSAVAAGTLLTLAVLSRHDTAAEYARAAQRPIATPLSRESIVDSREVGSALPVGPLVAGPITPNGVQASTPGVAALPAQPVGGALSAAPGGTALAPEPVGAVAPVPVAVPAAAVTGSAKPAPAASTPPKRGTVAPYTTKAGALQWPSFRGPAGVSLAVGSAWPTTWDGPAKRGVLWRAAVPLPGWNSPIVWGDRVLLSGADKTHRAIFCYAAATGKLLWTRPVAASPGAAEVKVSEHAGYAPATMVTDGLRACAAFPNGDVACVDLTGRLLWTRALGLPENNYGHASCPVIYGGGLIVQMDQGFDPDEGKSSLMALDLKTGKAVWQVKRPVQASWSTPILIRAGSRDELVTCANPLVIAYDPHTGTELWRAAVEGGEVAPSPAVGSSFVFTANDSACLAAIRPGGTGDVTKTAVAWKFLEGMPDIVSPVSANGLVFLLTSEGMLTCVDATIGKKVWEHDFSVPFRATPVIAGGKLYALESKGVMHVLDAGRAFKELGKAALGEDANASPAFAAGRIYLRGKEHLVCVGAAR